MSDLDAELERLRDAHPAHPKCLPCRQRNHDGCEFLTRPTSCSCGCPWLLAGRQPSRGDVMDLWYPPAVHDPHDDAGPFVNGPPPRGVLHTTESAHYPSYQPGTHPHFTVWCDSAGKVHVTQHVPINHASSALVHASGQVDTNREDAIQIEIAWFAGRIGEIPRPLLVAVRTLMRWLEAQAGIRRHAPPFKAYPASYGANNGVRMTVAEWRSFSGWCGHEHVPENDHGDPGAIDIAFLLRDDTPPPAPDPRPHPSEEKTVKLIQTLGDPNVYVTDFITKRHVTNPAELQALKPMLTDQGVHHVSAAVRDAIPTVHA